MYVSHLKTEAYCQPSASVLTVTTTSQLSGQRRGDWPLWKLKGWPCASLQWLRSSSAGDRLQAVCLSARSAKQEDRR